MPSFSEYFPISLVEAVEGVLHLREGVIDPCDGRSVVICRAKTTGRVRSKGVMRGVGVLFAGEHRGAALLARSYMMTA